MPGRTQIWSLTKCCFFAWVLGALILVFSKLEISPFFLPVLEFKLTVGYLAALAFGLGFPLSFMAAQICRRIEYRPSPSFGGVVGAMISFLISLLVVSLFFGSSFFFATAIWMVITPVGLAVSVIGGVAGLLVTLEIRKAVPRVGVA